MVGRGAPFPATKLQGRDMTNSTNNKKPIDKIDFQFSWMEPFKDSPMAERGLMFRAICEYAFYDRIIDLPKHLKARFKTLRREIDQAIEDEGGLDDLDNLQILCRRCNSSKGAKHE